MSAEYDDREARMFLGRTAMRTYDEATHKAASEANRELVAALLRLDNQHGFRVEAAHPKDAKPELMGVAIYRANGASALVRYNTRGESSHLVGEMSPYPGPRQFKKDTPPTPVAVVFDPALNMFRGTAYDDTLAPEPGKPRPWRSAVAVIVEVACAICEQPVTR